MLVNKQPIVAAFTAWHGSKSLLYLASEDSEHVVETFIEQHYDAQTFAKIYTFTDEDEARKAYEEIDKPQPVFEPVKPYVVYLNKSYDCWAVDGRLYAEKHGIDAKEIISEVVFWHYLKDGHLENVPVYFCKDILDTQYHGQ